jgi:hypothetical protein
LYALNLAKASRMIQTEKVRVAESSQKRIREDLAGTQKSLKFVVYMGIVGAIMIGLSIVAQYITL